MISLAQLSQVLGSSLRRAVPGPVPSIQLSGVHVSELADPTPYLEGGELLLTTGIPLEGTAAGAYVRRLAAKGVAALGLGLGEGLESVPADLVLACAAEGVELLVVPDGVPFLDVSRAFWDLTSRGSQADLIASLGTQTALARAATRPDAVQAVVEGLAQALGGWAAYLPADGAEATVRPSSAASLLPHLKLETTRLNVAGTHSAATFWLHGSPVVEYPILVGRRIEGFLAIGPGRTLTKADRQIIMTVCVLLAMKAQQQEELSGTSAVLGSAVAKLLVRGELEAARMVAADSGLDPLPRRVRVLAARMETYHSLRALAGAVARLRLDDGGGVPLAALAACTLSYREGRLGYFLLDPGATEAAAEQAPAGGATDVGLVGLAAGSSSGGAVPPAAAPQPGGQSAPETGAAWTEALNLPEIARAVAALQRSAELAPAGRLLDLAADDESRADGWVDSLAGYRRADLVATVAAYLRHRGHWEETARQLGVHRNSLRHRMAVAERVLGVSVDDPDVAARLWLALRRHGH
ncbi:PucR family transcriptional regulator [Arthrobacter sp. NPDC055138]